MQCPTCNSQHMELVPPAAGTTYVLTCANTTVNPPDFLATTGLPLELYGCVECKTVIFKCESLRRS